MRPSDLCRRLLLLAGATGLVYGAGVRVGGQPSPAPQPRLFALKGATVVTVTKGTIANGIVVIRDGKIAAAGANVDVPAGAEVVDVTGRFVSPGIIDAHSHIASDSINEGGTTVSSMTGIEDVLDPTDIDIYRDLAGGLTTANVLHGSANPIGGKNAVIKLRWGKTRAEEVLFEGAPPGIKLALGENPKDMRQFGQTGPRRYPVTRAGTEFVIRDAFTRAKAYQKAWRDYESAKADGKDVLAPRRDLQLEPLVEILEGKRLVHAHCYRADEILMLIRLAEEMGFKIATFQHVLEGYKVAKEIAAHGAGASTFSDWWGYKIEAVDAIPYNPAIMVRKGVLVSVNSDSAEHARRLNTEAAKSIKWGGLSDDEALALVTINPARQLKIDGRVGSIEAGKDADLVVWTHHPLSSYAIVDRTYIDGILYYDRRADERRLTQLKKEKSDLATAERSERRDPSAEAATDRPKATSGAGGDGAAARHLVQDQTRVAGTNGGAADQAVSRRSGSSSVWAITNATIHPVTKPTIERGAILVRGEKIEAIGANLQIPPGATILDAKGQHVYPGFINARTTMGIAEPGPRGFDDVNEMLDLNPQLRIHVSYHTESDAIPVARANGITTVAVAPGGGTLAGQMAVMNLDGWTWEEALVRPNAGIVFNFPLLGGAGGRGGGRAQQQPDRTFEEIRKERDRKLDELNRLFDQARAYAKAGATRTIDWTLEALVPVVERRLPLITTVNREQDIRDAVAFADRAKVNMVISGGSEAALVAPLLKERNIPVLLGTVLTLPSREDFFHAASYQLAGELAQAGVKFAFSTGDSSNVRLLPYHAAMAIAWGLSHDAALRALTVDAAEILGVADRVGSLEAGKDANLLIADGDPLEIRTNITQIVIAGRVVPPDNKHLALYQKYIARP